MERSVKIYAKHGKRFTQGIIDCCKQYFARIDSFGRIWFRRFPFNSRTKKLCWSKTIVREHKKTLAKGISREIKNLINNQTFLIEDQNEGEPVTPCMDVYKSKIQSNGSIDKLKFRIVVRGDLQNKSLVKNTWSPTASMSTLKYFLTDAAKH